MEARESGDWRRWTLASLGLGLAARILAGPLPLNYYDVGYALVWGREILAGHLPDLRTPGASTPHPLGTLLATLAALGGSPGAWYVVQVIVFLSFGVAGTALFLLARTCLGRVADGSAVDGGGVFGTGAAPGRASLRVTASAALAAGALLLSPPFLTDALGGSGVSDLPALALVLAAAAIAAEHPGRTRGPLVLLGLAGLLRPEAWGLAGAYWLYLARARRPPAELILGAGLVLAAPILWAIADQIVVGDPTYSLTHTQDASHAGAFAHGLGQVPAAGVRGLRALVGLPVLAVGSLGAVAALVLARRATAPALALLALAVAEFAGLGIAGVPLLERFLLVAAAMICLFFAYALIAGRDAILGRLGAGHSFLAPTWTVTAAVLLVYVAASHLQGDAGVRGDRRAAVNAEADLVSLAAAPGVRTALRGCPVLYVPRYTLTSLVAYDFDRSPREIMRTATRPPRRGLILAPAAARTGAYFGVTPARLAVLGRLTSGSRPLSANRSWRLYSRGCP
jgi:hypothetical protein